jgi:addiction module RelE/StbE family toxin
MPYIIIYVKKVIKKDLRELSHPILKQIKQAIEKRLMIDPIAYGKPLRYNLKGCRSLRVGDYRIVYQINEQTVTILAIKHRRKVYL